MNSTKQEKLCILLSTFTILYVSTSYVCKNLLSETVNTAIMAIALVPVLCVRKRIHLHRTSLLSFGLLSLISIMSSLFSHDTVKMIIYPCLILAIALIFSSVITIDEFKEAFSRIMVFVALFSILVYVVYYIYPNLIFSMPKITNTSGNEAYNLLFAVVSPMSFYRSEGFFWEPGAFQTFLNLSIPIIAFSTEEKRKRRIMLMVLYIAVLLTFSTTAWIVGILNLMIILMDNPENRKRKKTKWLLALIVVAMLVLLCIKYLPKTIGGSTFGIEKIRVFLNGTSRGSFDSSSVRFDSIYYPFQLFLRNPILGAGYSGLYSITLNMYHNMLTCTPINYFAMYGIIYGAFVLVFIMNYCKTINRNRLISVLLLLAFLLSIFSEQYVNYAILDVFIIYGTQNPSTMKAACNKIHQSQVDMI